MGTGQSGMASTTRTRGDANQTHVTRYHPQSTTDPISYTIAEALAAAEGVAVTELEICLAEHIAVDALNTMFEQAAESTDTWSLTFTVTDYLVQVDGTGQVTVTDEQ